MTLLLAAYCHVAICNMLKWAEAHSLHVMTIPSKLLSNAQHIETTLSLCMLADRHVLRRRLRDAADLQNLADENSKLKTQRLLGEIAQKIRSSQQKFAIRLANLPKPEYPLELPVSSRRDEISEAIKKNRL